LLRVKEHPGENKVQVKLLLNRFSQNRYDYDIVVTVRKFPVLAQAVEPVQGFLLMPLACEFQVDCPWGYMGFNPQPGFHGQTDTHQ
jgi:hypothetical protein